MGKIEIFKVVSKDFGIATAVNVVAINAIHMATKPTKKDITKIGSFEAKIKQLAKDVLWEETQKDFTLAFTIAMSLYEYDICQSLQGLGGCVPKSLIEIVDSKIKEVQHG